MGIIKRIISYIKESTYAKVLLVISAILVIIMFVLFIRNAYIPNRDRAAEARTLESEIARTANEYREVSKLVATDIEGLRKRVQDATNRTIVITDGVDRSINQSKDVERKLEAIQATSKSAIDRTVFVGALLSELVEQLHNVAGEIRAIRAIAETICRIDEPKS